MQKTLKRKSEHDARDKKPSKKRDRISEKEDQDDVMDDDEDLPVELKAVLKKLNSEDEDIWKQGILVLQQAAMAVNSETTGENIILAYLDSSPDCTEILEPLAGESLRDNGKTRATLSLLEAILECHKFEPLKIHAQRLATRLVRRMSKALASAFTTTNSRLAAAALSLISKITVVGVIQARDCWKRFNPHLKVISKLFVPQKESGAKNEKQLESAKAKALRQAHNQHAGRGIQRQLQKNKRQRAEREVGGVGGRKGCAS
jgi:hypothetical protein